jgi:hypothetical protein
MLKEAGGTKYRPGARQSTARHHQAIHSAFAKQVGHKKLDWMRSVRLAL